MPQRIKLPSGRTFVQYDYRTDGKYWLQAGRKPWWDAWLKLLLIAGLIFILWPLVHLLIVLLAMGLCLACLSIFLIPLNAFLDSGKARSSRRRRSNRW